MSKTILITGGAGFIGHHFVEHFLKNTNWEIVVLDKLNYASVGWERLRDISAYRSDRVKEIAADFSKPLEEGVKKEIGLVDYIIHMGAESHVDRSIADPMPFIESNVVGTQHMINFAIELISPKIPPEKRLKCFFYFGTDEVFGSAPPGVFHKENDQHNPANPYAATKSGGEMLVKAAGNTHKMPWIITRSMNIFGERQHPEKFIPLVVKKVLAGETVLIHANRDLTKAGVRQYIHARNVATGYQRLIDVIENEISEKPKVGFFGIRDQEFHITGEREVDNLELAHLIAKILNKELNCELVDFHSSRPGHDLRYALDGSKMAGIGWVAPKTFEQSLEKTIKWTTAEENKKWIAI